ncbi:hypothetical protein T484DRAFT_1755642 [Baffinella frigidus]|nr:hypothetical protein T484DRAFT_1755642 [Cryptophyta sp. CCMP2293]
MPHRTDAECAALVAGIGEGFRAIQARLEPVAGASAPPTGSRIRDTKMKHLPDPAACPSGLGGDSPSRQHTSLSSPAANNVRRLSSECRLSVAVDTNIEAICLMLGRDTESEFMARVESQPPLFPSSRSSSPSPLITAAGCAAASIAGVKLAMENSFKRRNLQH